MNFKLTFSLVIVLLVATIIYLLMPKGPVETKGPDQTTPLIASKPKVSSITFIQNGTVQVKFEKKDGAWRMTQPMDASVEDYSVSPIAGTLEDLSYKRKFEPEASGDKSADATGTDKPRNVVKFTDENGKEYTVAFGKRSEDGYFATLNGDKTIYVLSASPVDSLDKDPQEFRNKIIKQVDTSKIAKLEIKTRDSDVTLSKTGDKWAITSPINARANETTVEDLVKELATIQALKFSPLDKDLAQLTKPVVAVTAWLKDSASTTAAATQATASGPASQSQPAMTAVTLDFGVFSNPIDPTGSPVYAGLADSPDVFTLSRDSYNKFNHNLQDLRDPAVTPAPVRTATAFTFTSEGSPALSATRKDDVWTISSGPASMPGDAAAISNYLGDIADLRAIKFVDNAGDLKSIGLDPPQMKIDLTVPGQSQHEVLFVGKPETADPVTPVMRQGEPTVYLLQSSGAKALSTSMLALRDHNVDMVNADEIQKIEISGPSATAGVLPASTVPASMPATASATAAAAATLPATMPAPGVTLVREGTHWMVKKDGASVDADESKISSLLADFTPLTAVKYLQDKPVDASTPAITVKVSVLQPTITTAPATTVSIPATAPATNPATPPSTAPSTAPAAATQPAGSATAPATASTSLTIPSPDFIGPDRGKTVEYTLQLYKQQDGASTTWKGVWDHQSPAWTFQPAPGLMEELTTDVFVPSAATSTAPAPATMPNP